MDKVILPAYRRDSRQAPDLWHFSVRQPLIIRGTGLLFKSIDDDPENRLHGLSDESMEIHPDPLP